jgi:hypothetical protein
MKGAVKIGGDLAPDRKDVIAQTVYGTTLSLALIQNPGEEPQISHRRGKPRSQMRNLGYHLFGECSVVEG